MKIDTVVYTAKTNENGHVTWAISIDGKDHGGSTSEIDHSWGLGVASNYVASILSIESGS